MKISIGSPIVDGPWGGGNLFLINLKNYLQDHGHDVLFDLKDPDLDIILFTDPRTGRGSTSNYGKKDIKRYKKKNNKVKVVQSINECDQRKNTKNIGAIHCAKVAHDNLLKQQRELKDKDFDMKVTNFRNHYTYEIKVLLVASSKGHRLHIPSDREIRFFGQP